MAINDELNAQIRVLADAEVAGDPTIAPPAVDGMEHLGGEPVGIWALAGLAAEFLVPAPWRPQGRISPVR